MSSEFDLVVFDLDGTLVETREDLAASVNYALEVSGLDGHPVETICHFVGDGALKLIQRAVGQDADQRLCEDVLRIFIEHYTEHCTDQSRPYPGVREIIPRLSPLPLSVLTNKPSVPTGMILDRLNLAVNFSQIIGGDSEHGRKPDPAGLLSLVAEAVVSPGRTLLVGDTKVDVQTARNAGCKCAGAKYGFRPGDFNSHPPDYYLEEFQDLLEIV